MLNRIKFVSLGQALTQAEHCPGPSVDMMTQQARLPRVWLPIPSHVLTVTPQGKRENHGEFAPVLQGFSPEATHTHTHTSLLLMVRWFLRAGGTFGECVWPLPHRKGTDMLENGHAQRGPKCTGEQSDLAH